MTALSSRKALGVAAMIAASLNFAAFGFIARFLNSDLGVYHQLWMRVGLMALIGLCLPSGRRTLRSVCSLPRRSVGALILQAALIYPLGALTWVAAVQLSPLATVAFITALPVEAVWGALLFKDRIGIVGILFLLLAVTGLWVVVAPGNLGVGQGEILALISSLSFSLGIMLSARWKPTLSRMESNVCLSLIGSVMIAVLGFCSEPLPSHLELSSLGLIVGGATLILVNFNLLSIGFTSLSGALAGTVLMLEVLFAGLIGFYFFGEVLASKTIYGGLLIVGSAIGLMLLERTPRVQLAIPTER